MLCKVSYSTNQLVSCGHNSQSVQTTDRPLKSSSNPPADEGHTETERGTKDEEMDTERERERERGGGATSSVTA